MIEKISRVKDFGVFADFRWPADLPCFKRLNLIYGWNYSGKTTLSRVFRCFEKGQVHADFPAAQAELKSADGLSAYSLASLANAPVFRVFNSDFVEDHLQFDTATASPILILGAEDIAKQTTLRTKREQLEALSAIVAENESKTRQKREGIQGALTRFARDLIKLPLQKPNYDKTKFEPRVKESLTSQDVWLLDDATLGQRLSVYQSSDKKPKLDSCQEKLTDTAQIREKASGLLGRVVTASVPLSRLGSDPDLADWVRRGRPLHEGKETCQFCGQSLPRDFLAKLDGHYSTDYEDLMSKLTAALKEIRDAQVETVSLCHESALYPDLCPTFAAAKKHLEDVLNDRKTALGPISEALTAKQTKAFSTLACPVVHDPADEIAAAVKTINDIIELHNSRTAGFEGGREDAFMAIERHYAALFVRDQHYGEELDAIAALEASGREQNGQIANLRREIALLELEVSQAAKGAEHINGLIAAYFGKDDLRLEVSGDNQFKILRRGLLARNLSEGEKTAIAFAYFITRVQDGRIPLAESRVVIDDPISSLDANHLFNTYALIKTQLAECRQLFIATHSFEFFNLVREWAGDDERGLAKKPQDQWEHWGIFLAKRLSDGTATLERVPRELVRFKSEFHYLFAQLHRFCQSGPVDFDGLVGLPNVARRFMEAFAGIMIPRCTGLQGKMDRLFRDPVARERVWKFVNYYSHNTTLARSLVVPDMSECAFVVGACLEAVKTWNGTYYDELVSEVS